MGFFRGATCTFCLIAAFFIFLATFPDILAAQSTWKEEWQKTVRAAEVEGQLTLYGCCYEYDRILETFKKKYPTIKVTTVLGSGGQLGARILAERRGEKYLADVFSGGANTLHDVLYHKIHALEPIKPALILPEVLDQSKWYGGEHRYLDPEKRYIFAFVITVSRDARQMTDWLASGKFSLCIRCNAGSEVGKAIEQGLPIRSLDTESWKEGGSSSAAGGTLGIPSRAPHPNAAKVFINWFFSREGQIALQKLGRPDAHNSRRIDIAKDDVDPYNRLEEGKKYFDLAKPEYQDLTPIFKVVKEVLPQK